MRCIVLIGGLTLLACSASVAQPIPSKCIGPNLTTAVALWTCRNAEMHAYVASTGLPIMDIQSANETAHLANAQNFDAHRITSAEWLAIDDKIDSDFTTDVDRRTAAIMQQRDSVYAQQLQQLRAAQALEAPQSAPAMPQMPFQPALPTTTNCYLNGPNFSCTTQ